jgi:DNA segregation ATPase FtsK/SpoIIIE, S-DNA-T family
VSKYPGIHEVLALLNRLRSTVRDFTAREKALRDDRERQAAVAVRELDRASKEEAARMAEALARVQGTAEAAHAQSESNFESRRLWIRQAEQASHKRILAAVDHEEGRAKYQLQKATLQAERRRELELANSTAVWDEFNTRLVAMRDAFLGLEYEAHRAFGGYGRFRQWLLQPDEPVEADLGGDENGMLTALEEMRASVGAELEHFRRFLLVRLFRWMPIWPLVAVLVVGHAAALFVLPQLGWTVATFQEAGWSLGISLAIVLAVYGLSQRQAAPMAARIAADLARARQFLVVSEAKAADRRRLDQERARQEFADATRTFEAQWQEAVRNAEMARDVRPKEIQAKVLRAADRNRRMYEARTERLKREYGEAPARIEREAEARRQEIAGRRALALAKVDDEAGERWTRLQQEWKEAIEPMYDYIGKVNQSVQSLIRPWNDPAWSEWAPPGEFRNAVPFGRIEVALEALAEVRMGESRLKLPGPAEFSLPLTLVYPQAGSILMETGESGQEELVMAVLNNILFRLLAVTPADKVSLTVLDPVGLGQNFAGLMHLADYEGSHLDSRIWTQPAQIEERLAELNEHMEKVIQMYLRNEYETIAEYNAQAGVIAEKYHLLIIAGFPVNFSETAARRLLNIAASGARCGVYTLIHWDRRHALPHDFVPENLRKSSVTLLADKQRFVFPDRPLPGIRLVLDAPPAPDVMTAFLHRVGRSSKDRNRVEVPFSQVAPTEADMWSVATTEELRVAIGRSGATKLQYLAIGKGTRQHGLIAGKTGSGKSTLFHVLITNLALWCSPEQVEFYLVDFKKGVEFKCYASRRLPHARVVAIESDREFGLSVLQRVDEELRRRGDLFRSLGVQDLAGYERAGGVTPLPRSLLIIDEFQEFFVEEDRISQNAAVLLDRIVRQGRAFGIHALLGSQTLGGAYTLARATIGQMVIRVALQCNEADAMLIMDENNAAARLLSRPGEGIYNDMAGALEGNSPFQVVWLPDEERDQRLGAVRERADQSGKHYPGPIVFEGNAPADIEENDAMEKLIQSRPVVVPQIPRLWLGSPNSIKGPTEAVFPRQSGSHLMVVGQREESALAIVGIGLLSLAAQYPREQLRIILVDALVPGSADRERLDRFVAMVPHEVIRPGPGELATVLSRVSAEVSAPADDSIEAPMRATFLFIVGLQQFKALRQEDDFSFSTGENETNDRPAARLLHLIQEGPGRGLHVVVTCDAYNNVSRWFGRKLISEFEMRVLFQMSASDSASLVDTPDASSLGLHRALLYHEREGRLEKFRPYAPPANEWLDTVARQLSSRE